MRGHIELQTWRSASAPGGADPTFPTRPLYCLPIRPTPTSLAISLRHRAAPSPWLSARTLQGMDGVIF